MNTEYHCPKCDVNFSENGLPNINKIHRACGSLVKVVRYMSEDRKSGKD